MEELDSSHTYICIIKYNSMYLIVVINKEYAIWLLMSEKQP